MAAIQMDCEIKYMKKRFSNESKEVPNGISNAELDWQLPEFIPMAVQLTDRTCQVYDATFKRRYLVEERPKGIPIQTYETNFLSFAEENILVGTLVWGKIEDWPWWPAMISVHPQRDSFVRYHNDGTHSYHVQYFGPDPYHQWVRSESCKLFEGFNKFKRDMNLHIKSSPPVTKRLVEEWYSVKKEDKNNLNQAIAEAEAASLWSCEVRLKKLTYWYYSTRYEKYFP